MAKINLNFIPKIIMLIADLLLVMGSFYFATILKYGNFNHPYFQHKSLTAVLIFILFLWGVIFVLAGLYRPKRGVFVELDEIGTVILACSISAIALIFFSYFTKESIYSRRVVVYAWFYSCVFISFLHVFVQKMHIGSQKIILIGEGRQSDIIDEKIKKFKNFGYTVIRKDNGRDLKKLSLEIKQSKLDGAVIALPREDITQLLDIVQICEESGLDVWVVPGVLELVASRMEVDDIDGIPLISLSNPANLKWQFFFKRVFDILVSGTILALIFPFLTVISILILITSKGKVFFIQKRIGLKGKSFNFIKFRTMHEGADKKILEFINQKDARKVFIKVKDDPRITPIGRWLRKYSIDELPQLINVLKGDMSLVGPRPLFKEGVDNSPAWMRKRLRVLPGITGLWQISGRSQMSDNDSVLLDIYYIEHWSFWLDIKIILYTIPAVLTAKGAY